MTVLLVVLPSVLLLLSPVAAAQDVDFRRDVRPILSDRCFHCHGPDANAREADLRLDDESSVRQFRDGRVVVAPGEPDRSELIRRITATDPDAIMPPHSVGDPLSAKQVQILTQWVRQGAGWSDHWAFVAPVRSPPPNVPDSANVSNWIDNFILARLTNEGLTPSAAADRITLLRRVSFDLTGLPPSPSMAAAFLSNDSEQVYVKIVEDLLNSPHYGERMASYWLDLVRYADTVGYHGDQDHNISPYRDWVIDAFNSNHSFDQFSREQLAGDLLPQPTVEQIIATGYNRLLQTTHEGGLQQAEYRAIYAADRVRNVSAVWLGGTLGCAQCHDHKFDPYTSADFYSMASFFADIDDEQHFTKGTNALPAARPPELDLPTPKQSRRIEELELQRTELKAAQSAAETKTAETRTSGKTDAQQIAAQIKAIESEQRGARAQVRRTMITVPLAQPRTVRLLPRGNWLDNSGPVVQPAPPAFLGTLPIDDRRANRLDLANWLFDTERGIGLLTARVMVNRLWFLCFGSGLAGNLDDFGGQGEAPVHPELLDRLAHEFVERGWDMRAVMRLMVMSQTYRQASADRIELRAIDPENRLYARQNSFRLPSEMIRDNALAISGLLIDTIGGSVVKPYQPTGYYRHLNFPVRAYQQHDDDRQWRRGVYVHWQRQFLHPMLKAFGAPSREECTAMRPRSNTPQAALVLLNDPTFVEAAREFARTALDDKTQSDEARVALLFRRAVIREPVQRELDLLITVLKQNREWFRSRPTDADRFLHVGLKPVPAEVNATELAAWTAVSRTILNLAETNRRS